MYICVCMCIHVNVVDRGQCPVASLIIVLILGTRFLTEPGLHCLAKLISHQPQRSSHLCLPSTGIIGIAATLSQYFFFFEICVCVYTSAPD